MVTDAVTGEYPATLMDDQHAQFLIAVGDLCVAAALASLRVEVCTSAGSRSAGVPGMLRPASAEDEVDDSGYGRTFRIDDRVMNLDDIVECTIRSPERLAD